MEDQRQEPSETIQTDSAHSQPADPILLEEEQSQRVLQIDRSSSFPEPTPISAPPFPISLEAGEPHFTIQTDPAHSEPTSSMIGIYDSSGYESRYTIQTGPPHPEPTFTINTEHGAQRRCTIQTDATTPQPTFTAVEKQVLVHDQEQGHVNVEDKDRDPRAPMPTVHPLPPPPMRSKWGKHCLPICPPTEEEMSIEETGDYHDGDDQEQSESTRDVERLGDDNDHNGVHHHESSSWPDHCEPPLCFFTTTTTSLESQENENLEEGRGRSPYKGQGGGSGGLVRAEVKIGSVELRL